MVPDLQKEKSLLTPSFCKLQSITFNMKKVIWTAAVVLCTTIFNPSCRKPPVKDRFVEIVYVETNDKNQNAVIAYQNNGDGQLKQLPGGPFLTGGNGFDHSIQTLWANASDNEVIISNDHKFLLAVNSGSNTIAVFNINVDGTLAPVPGSPFPSGGVLPVSLAQWQQYIFVANKNSFPLQSPNQKPNYIVFRLESDGSLTSVPGARADLPTTASPCQVLVSRNNPFLFGAEFTNNISHYTINTNGTLGSGSGIPYVPANDVFGLCQHPVNNILYAGFPHEGATGVYDIIPETGLLSYKTSVNSGFGASNMRSNNAGDRLYVLNSYRNAVTVLNTSVAGAPTVLAKLTLKNPGPSWDNHAIPYSSSECHSLGFSSNEKFLFVVSQNSNFGYTPDNGNNNWLHVLAVQSDGTLTEPGEPIQLPVSSTVIPRGVAVYQISGQ
jgi:6-phosphogluconolactonase (cycloisomerase 2 family)